MPNCTHEEGKCEHPEVKYCKKCDKVYCTKCKKEWGNPIRVTYYPAIDTHIPPPMQPWYIT